MPPQLRCPLEGATARGLPALLVGPGAPIRRSERVRRPRQPRTVRPARIRRVCTILRCSAPLAASPHPPAVDGPRSGCCDQQPAVRTPEVQPRTGDREQAGTAGRTHLLGHTASRRRHLDRSSPPLTGSCGRHRVGGGEHHDGRGRVVRRQLLHTGPAPPAPSTCPPAHRGTHGKTSQHASEGRPSDAVLRSEQEVQDHPRGDAA